MAAEMLTAKEREALPLETRNKYDHAAFLCQEEQARGPWGGWADGYELLKKLGWMEVVSEVGHRRYINLEKPEIKTLMEA